MDKKFIPHFIIAQASDMPSCLEYLNVPTALYQERGGGHA
jgi:hypothetical protein